MIPLHQEDSRHQAVCDQDADAGEIGVPELSPQTLVEAGYPIVGICCTLSIWYAVEEVAVVGSFRPHPLHLGRAWLEVAKVLLSQPWLFIDGDFRTAERGGMVWIISRGERLEDALSRFSCAAVGRGEDLEGIVRLE